MVIGLRVCNHTSDNKIGRVRFVYQSIIADRIVLHEVLLPINHKNYNFRVKKNSQVVKEGKICIKILTKEK